MAATDIAFEQGLPADPDVERLILGSVLLDSAAFLDVAARLRPEDFSIEKHRRIFARMSDLFERGETIDRITLINELKRRNQLESVDGVSYIIALDDGLPKVINLDGYCKIVQEKSQRRKIIFSAEKIRDQALIGEEAADEILAEAEETLLRIGESESKDSLMRPDRILAEFEGGPGAFLDPSKRNKGISTGFIKLDEMTGGLRGGELVIIAARPAMGKTALALNIAHYVATNERNPQTVALFSLEMSKESLLTRLVCATAQVDQQKFRAGYLNQDERGRLRESLGRLMEAPLFLDDSAGATLMDIHAKLRKLKQQHGLGLVVIDYLQLMSGRGRFDNRTAEVSHLSRGLKLLSKELNVPIITLSQLSRATETRQGDHRPQLSDLRESGSIEQDADMVAFVFREEYYKPDRADLNGLAELILAKQRNGPTGKIKLYYKREWTLFMNPANPDEEPPPGD